MTGAAVPLRVLIVSADFAEAKRVMDDLEKSGQAAEWQHVDDAERLRQALGESAWDVVISDYEMAGFDAFAARQIVRDRARDLPFIACRSGGDLERLGDAVTREVEEARQRTARDRLISELERKVRVGEMFAGVLGHDLRNPLQTISMAAALLISRNHPSDRADLANRILRCSDRMERMIDQLLDFTSIRMGGGLPLMPRAIDLAELVRNAIDEIVGGSDADGVDLHVEGITTGSWDRDRLLQLVSNLVANALDHRTPGTLVGVHLDGRDPSRVVLEVENQGCIPPEILPTIFEPLQTTKRTRRDRASGLGLGLFISRQIARAHGGQIAAVSDAETGTRFVVDLPRTAANRERASGPTSFDPIAPPGSERTSSSAGPVSGHRIRGHAPGASKPAT